MARKVKKSRAPVKRSGTHRGAGSIQQKRTPAAFSPPEFGNMTPEARARWRSERYGNDYFFERQRSDEARVIGVASGDSWFDYLPARLSPTYAGDVVDQLNARPRFNIWKTSVAGDPVENMIWGTSYWSSTWEPHDTRQLPEALARIGQYRAAFFLFSGGGDDIAGAPLENYLNHADSGYGPVRESQLKFLIDEYLRAGYVEMIQAVHGKYPGLPIIFHGYDYPVADGRGVLNFPLGFHFVGPWLRPAFAMKRFEEKTMESVLKALIDTFNDMLDSLHDPGNKVYYLNLRGTLQTIFDGDYRNAWANELHPTDRGFELIASKFEAQILAALGP